MNKYEITTKKKKETIIQAALALFKDNGFSHVTIKEIAFYANVSQVSIYNYFGSKEALVTHCAQYIVEEAIKKAKEILLKDIDFLEKIKMALAVCTSEMNTLLSNYFSKKALSDPVLFQLLVDNINQSKREIYREYIEYGKREGTIDSNLSTNVILNFMDALNEVENKKELDESNVSELDQLYHLFLYGLVRKV